MQIRSLTSWLFTGHPLPESTARCAGIWLCPMVRMTSHNSFCLRRRLRFSIKNFACLSEIFISLLLHGEQSLSISIVVVLWFSCWIVLKEKQKQWESAESEKQTLQTKFCSIAKAIELYPSSPSGLILFWQTRWMNERRTKFVLIDHSDIDNEEDTATISIGYAWNEEYERRRKGKERERERKLLADDRWCDILEYSRNSKKIK